jgi:endonuclease/exonuclease/phosphatase family metal-dependent hydrolase
VGSGHPNPARLLIPGALLTAVLLQVLRVWLPSLPFVLGREVAVSGLVLSGAAIACLLPVLLVAAPGRVRTGRVVAGTAIVLVGCRLALQLANGGWAQLTLATMGAVAGVAALAAWATMVDGHLGRLAVLIGLVAESLVHLSASTFDLAWRQTPWAAALTVLLATATLMAVSAVAGDTDHSRTETTGPAWPWLATGPLVVLVTMVSASPGRASVATGWSPGAVAATLAGAHVVAVGLALAGPRWGPMRCGPLGAALVLLGTAGALRPAGVLTVVSQSALAIGAALTVAALAHAAGQASRGRVAVAGVAGWLLAVLLITGYDAWHELPTRLDVRYLLVAAAALLGSLALIATRSHDSSASRLLPRPPPSLAAATVLGVALVVGVAAAITGPDSLERREAAAADEITVALLNVQLGYDHRGRFAPIEQADALAGLDADLVVLTEVDRGLPQAGGRDVHRLLGERLGLAATFAPASDWLHGHAVLTDLPVTEVQRHRLPRGPGARDAGLLSVVVQIEGNRSLAVLATRLHPVEQHADVRRRQARAIAAEIARQRARGLEVVLLGDLQAEPQTPEIEPLESLLTATIPVGRATWPAPQPRRQLDHVLVSGGLEVADWTVEPVGVSDHLPLAVRLRMVEPAEDASSP